MRTGVAHLPLHYGSAPKWLFNRMTKLAGALIAVIVGEYGPEEFLKRLSDPFWFQAFGCALGFDWHSSGLTTTVCGAVKEGVRGKERDLGLFVAGGKGARSRKTPDEIFNYAEQFAIKAPPKRLVHTSRLVAKVDTAGLQDGYQIYQHSFLFTKGGMWAVVQQGMNVESRWARRYHWLSTDLRDFVNEPHEAVCCDHSSRVLNMVAAESEKSRENTIILSCEKPERLIKELTKVQTVHMPQRHIISSQDIHPKRLYKILVKTYEHQPQDFKTLLGLQGVGPATIRALALLSELLFKEPASVRDPVSYSFAHGGKDGTPYPVNRERYDQSIQFIKDALTQAKLGRTEKLDALKRLAKR